MDTKIKVGIIIIIITLFFWNYHVDAISDYENPDTGYKVYISDDADLLTDEEEERLCSQMIDLTQYGNIMFKSIDNNYYGSTSEFAKYYYLDICGLKSGTIFLIDMDYRNIYIYSYGSNYKIITKSKANIITDNTYRYATNEEYYECAEEAFSEIESLLKGEKIAEPMKYICNALLAIMLALLANFSIFKLVTKNKLPSNREIIKECKFKLNYTEPKARLIGSHKVYSPVSSSGGGSSGGRRWRPAVVAGGRRPVEVDTVSNKI